MPDEALASQPIQSGRGTLWSLHEPHGMLGLRCLRHMSFSKWQDNLSPPRKEIWNRKTEFIPLRKERPKESSVYTQLIFHHLQKLVPLVCWNSVQSSSCAGSELDHAF
jgi:hypothetical protein